MSRSPGLGGPATQLRWDAKTLDEWAKHQDATRWLRFSTEGSAGTDPGELTEVITLLDVRYKPTEIGRAASFHTFIGALREPLA